MSLPEFNILFNFQIFTIILGKHQVSYLANFTTCHTFVCQPSSLPELGGRTLTWIANRTPQPNFVHPWMTCWWPHPSHPFTSNRWVSSLESPIYFSMTGGLWPLPESPVSPPNDGHLPTPSPSPNTKLVLHHVCLPKTRCIKTYTSFVAYNCFLQLLQCLCLLIRAVRQVELPKPARPLCAKCPHITPLHSSIVGRPKVHHPNRCSMRVS